MKFLSLIAVLGLSVSAMAGTTVYHDYHGALRGIALENACVTDTQVETKVPTRNCTKLVPVTRRDVDMTYTDWVCERWETAKQSYPRAFSRTVCVKYTTDADHNLFCVENAQKADFLPDVIKVSVVTSNGEFDNFPGVQKNFAFPKCK